MLSESRAPRRLAGHALGVAGLLGVAAFVHRGALFARGALGDEQAYVCAARALARGGALAECPAYLYGSALARLGGAVVRTGGDVAWLAMLRGAVWLGAAFTVWASLALTRLSWAARLVCGAILLCAWPPVLQSLSLGNLSPATAALTVGALLLCEAHGVAAGLLLAAAILLKPLPAAVPAVLLGAAFGEWQRTRRLAREPIITALLSGALVSAVSWLSGGFPVTPPFNPAAENPITIVRVLTTLGVNVPALAIFLVTALGGAVLAARRPRRALSLAGLALVVSLLSSPLVWCHTWLLATPLIALASDATVASYRRAAPATPERSRALLHVLVVLQCTLSLSVSDAFGFVAHGTPLNALFVALPLVAPAVLLYFSEKTRWSTASSQGMPQPHSSRK